MYIAAGVVVYIAAECWSKYRGGVLGYIARRLYIAAELVSLVRIVEGSFKSHC